MEAASALQQPCLLAKQNLRNVVLFEIQVGSKSEREKRIPEGLGDGRPDTDLLADSGTEHVARDIPGKLPVVMNRHLHTCLTPIFD